MATVAELIRQRTALTRDETHHLQRLVSDWGMLADFCFADLLLYLPSRDGQWVVVNAESYDDLDAVVRTIMRVNEKMMSGMFEPGQGVEEAIRFQARKRIALKITPVRISSWDHGKLGGVY